MPTQIGGLPLLSGATADAVIPLQRPGNPTKGVRLDGFGSVLPSGVLGISHVNGLQSAIDAKQRAATVDARDFGAVGNGTGDQTTAINNAAATLSAAGGRCILGPGTYMVNGSISLPNFCTLEGQGTGNTVIRSTSTTADIITSTNTNLVGVRNMQIESLVTRTAGSAIAFTGVAGYIIDNVRFVDTYNLGTFMTSHSGWLSRLKLAHGSQVLNRGFYWQNCIDTHISCSLLNGGTVQLASGNAWIMVDSGCDTWECHDVWTGASSGAGTGFRFMHSLSPSSFAPRWIRMINSGAEGSSGVAGAGRDGIVIDDALCLYLVNGQISTSQNGLVINGGKDLRFTHLITQNNWLRGVLLAGGNGVHFTGCTFEANSQGADGNVGHLYAGPGVGRWSVQAGCYFGDRGLGRANQPNYAIENYSTPANGLVVGSEFEISMLRTGVFGGSTMPVTRNNFGFNPRGPLTAPTMPASTVAYTNAFGVDCTVYVAGGTVTAIKVNSATTGATSGPVRVPVGGNISITYSVAPTWVWIGE